MLKKAKKISDKMVEIRRKIHKYPELGMEEFKTSDLVAKYLHKLDLEVTRGVANTGVIGLLKGSSKGPTIALRADMDALPIIEQNKHSYISQVKGKMHACGHDGHTAILLGAAKLLSDSKKNIKGNIKFIFQPAEEGPGGALPMIKAGVLKNPKVDMIFGLHIATSGESVGKISLLSGPITASSRIFKVKIIGSGGHGAHPHKSIDSILASAHIISSMQSIISRELNPLESAVVSIGTIHGGYRHNIIADEVEITGTIRAISDKTKVTIPTKLERIIDGVCKAFRCDYEIDFSRGLPSLINDEVAVKIVEKSAEEIIGADNILKMNNPSMGGEDFCYFSEVVPSCLFRLHAFNEKKQCIYPLHHPKFNFDEECMPFGAAILSNIAINAIKYLNEQSS